MTNGDDMSEQLYKQAKETVCTTLEVPEDELKDDTLFVDDLNIDSILIIELKTRFEELYNIKIDKEDLSDLASLNDVVKYLTTRNIQAVWRLFNHLPY